MLAANSSPEQERIIEQLSYAIVEGILSTPMNYLRKEIEAGGSESDELMKIVAKLFQYDDEKVK